MAVENPFGDWDDYTPELMEKDAARINSHSSGTTRKLENGRHVYRALPGKKGWGSPFRETHTHWFQDAKGKFGYLCPADMEPGKRCPIDPAVAQLAASPNDVDQKAADQIKSKPRGLLNMIRLKSDGTWTAPETYDLPYKTVYKKLVEKAKDPDAGINFSHPVTGCDIIITRTGSTKDNTEYAVELARKSTQLQVVDAIQTQPDVTKHGNPSGRSLMERAIEAVEDMTGLPAGGPVIDHRPTQALAAVPAPRAAAPAVPAGPTAADDIDGSTAEDDLQF